MITAKIGCRRPGRHASKPRMDRPPRPPKGQTKTNPIITLRLPTSLAERLKDLAARDRRSLNSYVQVALERMVARQAKGKADRG